MSYDLPIAFNLISMNYHIYDLELFAAACGHLQKFLQWHAMKMNNVFPIFLNYFLIVSRLRLDYIHSFVIAHQNFKVAQCKKEPN